MATCETHGHIYGHKKQCVFCKSPLPEEGTPLAQFLSRSYDFSTQEDTREAMEMGRELFNAGFVAGQTTK